MDWYPLLNSLRIAAISTFVIFFVGIFAAYYIAKLPRILKGILDVILTLPLVLPPTVVGYLLLRVLGPKRVIGAWVLRVFGFKMVMTWWSAIFATIVVIFPLMYRTVRGAFESFDETLSYGCGRTDRVPLLPQGKAAVLLRCWTDFPDSAIIASSDRHGGHVYADRNKEMHPSDPCNYRFMLRCVAALAAFLCGNDRYPGKSSGSEHGRRRHCCQV